MGALRMRVSSRIRRHAWSTVGIACAVAIVTATVLTVAAGARRTASAPDRYTPSVGGDVDALLEQRSGSPVSQQVAALPAVGDLSAYTFVFGGDVTIPVVVVAAIVFGVIALANLTALAPARRARRIPTATLLRVE